MADEDPTVRSHAAWGLGQISHPPAVEGLRQALGSESDEEVRSEIERALALYSTLQDP